MSALGYFVIDRVATGEKIYNYRKALHLTQEGLSDLFMQMGKNVSVNSIGRWERGEVDISFQHACALCEIFQCSLYDDLLVFYLRDHRSQKLRA